METSKGKQTAKRIGGDLLYSIAGVAFFNIILQFIIYPYVSAKIGSAQFGDMLFLLAVVNIIAPSFGNAVNNTRMVLPEREKTENGDYMLILSCFTTVTAIVCLVISLIRGLSVIGGVLLFAVSVLTMFRFYANVEYRLNLEFKKQLVFYILLGVGYLVGVVPFLLSGRWEWIFMTGELLAVLRVVISGGIFRKCGKTSERRREIAGNAVTLAGSYLLTNLMLMLDRFVLLYFVDSSAVSEYYVLSLLGKTVAIIGIPLNSIIIGYLTKGSKSMDRPLYRKSVLGLLILAILFTAVCGGLTPVYIRLMYPALFAEMKDIIVLAFIVSLAQILYFVTNILLVIILTFVKAKWQLIIQIVYATVFIASAIGMTLLWEIRGFAYAAVISSSIYFLMTLIVGSRHIHREEGL